MHLYLMTMGVLAVSQCSLIMHIPHAFAFQPYRSRSLGSQSLELVINAAEGRSKPKINKIYLHVQVSNDGAKSFYERHGFKEVQIHEGYYKKIEPHDAWVLERTF